MLVDHRQAADLAARHGVQRGLKRIGVQNGDDLAAHGLRDRRGGAETGAHGTDGDVAVRDRADQAFAVGHRDEAEVAGAHAGRHVLDRVGGQGDLDVLAHYVADLHRASPSRLCC